MKKWIRLIVASLAFLAPIQSARSASTLSSEDFKILRSGVISGSQRPASQDFKIGSSFGEPISDRLSSTDFSNFPGLQNLLTIPGTVTSLSALTGSVGGSIRLSWISPGSDGTQGNIAGGKFQIDYSTNPDHLFDKTTFQVQIPTSCSSGDSESYVISGLMQNTTYFIRIFAVDGATNYSYISNAATATTNSAVIIPGNSAISAVNISSISVNWGSNGNVYGTQYEMQVSSSINFETFSSSLTYLTFASTSSLIPNSSYYFRVRAYGVSGDTSTFNTVISTPILAAPPTAGSFQIFVTSVSVSLNANGNPAGTNFVITTGSFAVADSSAIVSSGSNPISVISGLQPNTTYTIQARAINISNLPTSSALIASTATFAAIPGAIVISPSDVGISSVTISWSSNGNPLIPPTSYQVQISTDSGFVSAVTGSSETYSLLIASSSLVSNSSYYFRVSAYNRTGGQSAFNDYVGTCTLAASPGFSGFQIFITSASVNLVSNHNSINTVYRTYASTDGFNTFSVSSQGAVLLLTLNGLVPNTSYQIGTDALNFNQIPSTRTVISSTFTLPSIPGASTFTAIAGNSISAGWLANGNPLSPPTTYEMQVSTSANFSPFTSSVTFLTQATTSGLTLNTLYNFRVRAIGQNGDLSSFNTAISTTTGANSPGVAGFQVYTTSISVTLSPNGNGEGTSILITTGTFEASSSSQGVLGAGNTTLVIQNLMPNTVYAVKTRAISLDNISSSATVVTSSTITLASPIEVYGYTIFSTSVSVILVPNGNPQGTSIMISTGTDGNFSVVNSSIGVVSSGNTILTIAGLTPNSFYAFEAGVRNNNVNASTQTLIVTSSTNTLATTPIVTSFQIFTTSVSVTLASNGNPQGTTVMFSTGTDGNYSITNSSIGVFSGGNSTLTITGLTPNTFYSLQSGARDSFLNASTQTIIVTNSTWTFAAVPTIAGFNIFSTSITVSINPLSNPEGTRIVISTGTDENLAVALSSSGMSGAGNVTLSISNLIPNTLYGFQAAAVNGNSPASTVTVTITASTYTLPSTPGSSTFTVIAGNSISAGWQVNGNPLSPPTTYEMQVSTSANFSPFTSSVTFLTQATTSGLTLNTLYNFRVRAIGQSGDLSSFNTAISTTTGANSPGVIAFQVFTTSISVTLSPNGNGAGTTLSITTGSFETSTSSSALSEAGNTILVLSNLVENRNYTVLAHAVNLSGISSTSTVVASTATYPAVPGVISVVLVTNNSIAVSWNNNNNSLIPATSYQVQISSNDPAFSNFTTSNTFSLSLTTASLAPATTYYFRVFAYGVGGTDSSLNNAISTITLSQSPTAPSTPTALTVTAISANSITLGWIDNSVNENGFYILNSTNGLYGTTSANSTSLTISGLSPNSLITARVAAFNSYGASTPTVTISSYSFANPPTGTFISNTSSTSITVNWTTNGNPSNTLYHVYSSIDSGFALSVISVTSSSTNRFINLNSNSTYYFRVQAQNNDGIHTTFDATISTHTSSVPIPQTPTELNAVAGDKIVTLSWTANTESNLSGYNIYQATSILPSLSAIQFGSALQPIIASTQIIPRENFTKLNLTPVTTNFYIDTGLTNGINYYYKVTAINSLNLESDFSSIVSAIPTASSHPREPLGLKTSFNSLNQFVLSWSPVTQNDDGSALTNLSGYKIYRANFLNESVSFRSFVSSETFSFVETDTISFPYFYLVRSVNSLGNESINSTFVQATSNPSLFFLSADNSMEVEFSQTDSKMLNADSNQYGEDIVLRLNRNASEENQNVIGSYEIKSYLSVSNREVTNFIFPKPTITLTFRYTIPSSGSPAFARSATGFSPKDLSVFWFNGVEYIKLGGEVDELQGFIRINFARPTGKFQVRISLRATSFTIVQVEPKKFITPNHDGVNDVFTVYFENPNHSLITQAKIYDINGGEVADMQPGQVTDSLAWDGRGRDGEVVNGALYIYQIKAEGKVINGTVVVFR